MSEFGHLAGEHGVRNEIADAFDREWAALRRPGSFLSSPHKMQIADAVRGGGRSGGGDGELAPVEAGVVERIVTAPASVRRPWVDEVVAAGLPVTGYVEILGVVSRMMAVDGFHRVADLPLPGLPAPGAGEPTGDFNPMAVPSKAFVPMTRGTSIWWSLTLVPEAYTRMEDLHCALYLSPEQMQSPASPWTLTRPQMELVAARTSFVNECFY